MITARCRIHGGRSRKAKELRELYGDIMTDLSRSEAGAGVVNGNFSFAGDKQRILIGVAAERSWLRHQRMHDVTVVDAVRSVGESGLDYG